METFPPKLDLLVVTAQGVRCARVLCKQTLAMLETSFLMSQEDPKSVCPARLLWLDLQPSVLHHGH